MSTSQITLEDIALAAERLRRRERDRFHEAVAGAVLATEARHFTVTVGELTAHDLPAIRAQVFGAAEQTVRGGTVLCHPDNLASLHRAFPMAAYMAGLVTDQSLFGMWIIADPNVPRNHGTGRYKPPRDWPFTDWETDSLPGTHWTVRLGMATEEITEPVFWMVEDRPLPRMAWPEREGRSAYDMFRPLSWVTTLPVF